MNFSPKFMKIVVTVALIALYACAVFLGLAIGFAIFSPLAA